MQKATPCPACGCDTGAAAAMHVVQAALAVDDLDRALDAGLLDCALCDGCGDTCTAALLAARKSRETALAARERHRAHNARLARRAAERDARRARADDTAGAAKSPALPPAAAAALARAKAKVSARKN